MAQRYCLREAVQVQKAAVPPAKQSQAPPPPAQGLVIFCFITYFPPGGWLKYSALMNAQLIMSSHRIKGSPPRGCV